MAFENITFDDIDRIIELVFDTPVDVTASFKVVGRDLRFQMADNANWWFIGGLQEDTNSTELVEHLNYYLPSDNEEI